MAELVLAKVTQKGQMTIPQELREALDIEAGDYAALRPLMDWVFMSKVSVSPQVKVEDVLRRQVVSLRKAAETCGIRGDEDLDAIIEEVQREAYRQTHGG